MRTFFKNKIVQISIFLLIAVALIYWQYSALSSKQVDEIRESFALTQWHYFFLALLVGFLSHFFRALRWQLMIHQVGFHTSKGVITSSVLMGYLTNLLIPRLGEVMRCTTLYKYEKVPIEKSVGTVVSERVFDLISLIALFFLVLVIEYDYVSIYAMELIEGFESKFQIQYHWSWWIIIGLIVGIGFFLLRFLYKKYLIKKIGHVLNSFIDGIRSIWTLERKFLFLFYSIIIWILYVLMVYIALKAVPATADLPIEVSMVLTAFGSIAIILTPGGIGAYPPIVAGLLSIYSIPYSLGLSAGWVSWLMQTIVVLILGIGTLIYLPFINKKRRIMEKKVEENSWNIEQKILDLKNLENVVHRERVKSRKIVFTNGCFDLLHLGHLDVLRKSRNFGDCLIVGLNTDSSVKRLKGEFRPIQDEKTRVMILASLAFVDYVVLFEEDTPLELINVIRPDVLVKGGDYNIEQIVGADIVLKNGGEVKIVDILPGHSTTDLVKKMK